MWVLFLIELGSIFYFLYPRGEHEKYVHWLLVLCFKHLSHVYTHISLLSLFLSLSHLLWFIYQPSWKCFLFARTHSRLTFTLSCCFVSLNEWIFVWVFVMYVIRNRFHFIKCTARFLRTSVWGLCSKWVSYRTLILRFKYQIAIVNNIIWSAYLL